MVNERLARVIELLPVIKQLFEQDVYLSVMDRDGVIQGYSVPDGVAPMLSVGQRFEDPSGAFNEVIRFGRRKHNKLPKEVMGEAFEGELVPIKDGGGGCRMPDQYILCWYKEADGRDCESVSGVG